jgi:acetate kinase
VLHCAKHGYRVQFAVFDTAFHRTIPMHTQLYPIPKKFSDAGIQKYGFHGISHEYISRGFKGRVITCHLGSGASICAIRDGVSVQTSMGFTPLDGLVMGTRCGTIGMDIVPFMISHLKLSLIDVQRILEKESGLLAIGGSNDVRDLIERASRAGKTGRAANLALDMYVQRIIETIGSYVAVLGGLDTLIFSAGTGERSAFIRKRICAAFKFVGLTLDLRLNEDAVGKRLLISSSRSKVAVYVVPTNEELAIAEKVLSVL